MEIAIFGFDFEKWITNISSWWCNDLSILLTLTGFAVSCGYNVYLFHKSQQIKLSVIGDISPTDNSKIQITVSNVGKVNARLGKIGIEFCGSEKWYKPKSGGSFETLYRQESLDFDPILAAGETVRIYMDLAKIKKGLEHCSLDNYQKEALIINKICGWVYLFRNKLKASDNEIKELENELNDRSVKRYSIDFSEVLILALKNHIHIYCKNQS